MCLHNKGLSSLGAMTEKALLQLCSYALKPGEYLHIPTVAEVTRIWEGLGDA